MSGGNVSGPQTRPTVLKNDSAFITRCATSKQVFEGPKTFERVTSLELNEEAPKIYYLHLPSGSKFEKFFNFFSILNCIISYRGTFDLSIKIICSQNGQKNN